ncbi:MAG: YkgJ family cysteine cluster protein [Candidatus Omnitrophota bacterium]
MLKQLIKQKYCLICQGCCRFQDSNSVWAPRLFNLERKKLSLSQKIVKPIKYKDFFICPYFLIDKNTCKIYRRRPFDCQLYPFLLNKNKNKIFLAIDSKCPFIGENKNSQEFKKYIKYLIRILESKKFIKKICKNLEFINTYPQDAIEIRELKKLSCIFNESRPS